MEPLHLHRAIAAPAREVVEHVRASFAADRGQVSLVDVSGQTFALALCPGPSTSYTVWTSIIVRDTAEGCMLVGRYRGTRGVSTGLLAVGIAWFGALALGAPLLLTTLGAVLVFVVLLVRRDAARTMGDPEAFAAMCVALDGVLIPLPLGSPYRTALAPASIPDEAALAPIVQSHTRAGEATKVWALPPRAPKVARPPAALAIPAPVPQVIVELPEAPPRIGNSLRCHIDVAAEPAVVHARLCAAFPENADATTAAAHTEDATPTGFVFIRTSIAPNDLVASVYVELVPLAEGTRMEVRWSRFRMQMPVGWFGYVLLCFCGLRLLAFQPLFGVLLLLSLALFVWFVHFHRGRRATEAFDLLARHLQVPLLFFPPSHDLVQLEADDRKIDVPPSQGSEA